MTDALELSGDFVDLHFEAKPPHGLRTKPPHIDVLLLRKDGGPVGIEVKFAEPFGKKHPCGALDPKYFPINRYRWTSVGLPSCQAVAESLGSTPSFIRLGAGQLLKHALGLANTFREFRPVELRYLWYDPGGDESAEHAEEIARFAAMVAPEVDFAAIRFQDFFDRLRSQPEPAEGYLAYLRARYFGG